VAASFRAVCIGNQQDTIASIIWEWRGNYRTATLHYFLDECASGSRIKLCYHTGDLRWFVEEITG